MCHVSAGKSPVDTLCSCGCTCPVALPVGDNYKDWWHTQKSFRKQIEIINRKITGLKTVNPP